MEHPPPKASGWWLLSWPLFQQQFDSLIEDVEVLARRDPSGYRGHPKTKLLATILRVISEDVPRDPGHKDFRQGDTLGPEYRSWFRAKFHQRYRLFFRYDSKLKAIIYTWVNADSGLRKAGDKNDPYVVFRRMLESGKPPTSFEELLTESDGLRLPTD